jgi:hypothetical protein
MRMRSDNALSSSAGLIFCKLVANSADNFAMKGRRRAASSNPLCSTFQSQGIRDDRRIARNPRVCTRFAIPQGPGERRRRPESAESSKTYPGAIWLGPWIVAVNSPADRTRRTGPIKADRNRPKTVRSCVTNQLPVAIFSWKTRVSPADSYTDRSVYCCRRPACSRRQHCESLPTP